MLLLINSFEHSFFQSSNVKGLLSDTIKKGKKSREGGKEGGRKGKREGRRKEGEGYTSIIKSNGARAATLDGEVSEGLSKEALEIVLRHIASIQ